MRRGILSSGCKDTTFLIGYYAEFAKRSLANGFRRAMVLYLASSMILLTRMFVCLI